MTPDGAAAGRSRGLLDSARDLAVTAIGILRTRIELLANEIQEEALRTQRVLVLAVAAAFCLGFGIVLLTLLVIVSFWETHRLFAIAGCLTVYIAAGVVLAHAACKQAAPASPLFVASLAELRKDQESLSS